MNWPPRRHGELAPLSDDIRHPAGGRERAAGATTRDNPRAPQPFVRRRSQGSASPASAQPGRRRFSALRVATAVQQVKACLVEDSRCNRARQVQLDDQSLVAETFVHHAEQGNGAVLAEM